MTTTPSWFDGFAAQHITTSGARIFVRTGGTVGAPPLLLLHGFPQTHALWHRVAQQLARDYCLVLPDLRSRLSQCGRIMLDALDDDGRGAVLNGMTPSIVC